MCGIAGIYHLENRSAQVHRAELQAMTRHLRSRGPDGEGYLCRPGIGLGHTRLSIIDLEGGQQPIRNEDGSIWTVFNGEIFNFVELRRELEGLGHQFYTHTDTEVLVHLYEEYGDEFVGRLNGQFAIALWDAARQRLLLVRDRVGIAPLFYARRGDRLIFGSEVKALLPCLGGAPRLDPRALDQIFTFWTTRAPRTLFEDVEELPPGEMLVVERGRVNRQSYWDWPFVAPGEYHSGTESELADELRALLIDATQLRLRADVPVGAYLSGGLDSSVIAALVRYHSDTPLRTFSIGFDDPGLDESEYQRAMIERLGSEHTSLHGARDEIAAHFPDAVLRAETALLRTAPVPMGMLSGLVREQNYKVVLTGEGADEVLGGYDLFKEAKIRQFWARQPDSRWRPLLLQRLYPYLNMTQRQGQGYLQSFFGTGLDRPDLPRFSHLPRWLTTAKAKTFFSQELSGRLRDDAVADLEAGLPGGVSGWDPFSRAQYLEAKTLMAGYLLSSQGDRMLMANSVEGRFPFLDHRLIEFAARLPPRFRMRGLREKYLLKRAMARYLPEKIVQRHKQPYRAPDIPAFFSGQPPEYVSELLSEDTVRRYGYFDPAKVALLLRKIRAGRAIGYKDNMALVGMLSTQLWHHHFIENYQANFVQDAQSTREVEEPRGFVHVSRASG